MIHFGKPAPDLSRQIEMCFFISSEGNSGTSYYEFLPDSSVKLNFCFSSSSCRMVLLGPATKKYCAEIDEASDYLCLRFHPGQAPQLADINHAELIDSYVELPEIRGVKIDSLAERFHLLPDLASRQLVLEDIVRGSQPLVRDERCRQATALLEVHGGNIQVNELADKFGLHIRSLERLFLDHLGLSPKRLTRIIRLRHLLACLRTGSFGRLADLAYACGYADQSHMIKEFKELTGRLPGETGSFNVRRLADAPQTRVVNRCRP